jgi:metallo-beta-lactamase family protein
MFQGQKEMRTRNYMEFAYDPASIEAVLLTHAHIDHSGLLPKLVKAGFSGPIYTTHASAELIEVLLHDSAHIQAGDVNWENKRRKRRGIPKLEPIYSPADVDQTLALVKEIPYHEAIEVVPGVIATWRDAGHIMGSAYLKLEITEDGVTKKLIASGDLGRQHQALIADPEVGSEADFLIIESTYGDRDHKNTDDTNAEIVRILEQVVADKGTLLIPAFAVGRTQEMIYRFFELSERNAIPPIKIFVDSPMASRVTERTGISMMKKPSSTCVRARIRCMCPGSSSPARSRTRWRSTSSPVRR